jgi:hypothetical protein
MWMLQPRRHHYFTLEPVYAYSGGEIRREDFYDNFSAERLLFCNEDARHAAATEFLLEGVLGTESALEPSSEVFLHASILSEVAIFSHRRLIAPLALGQVLEDRC